MYQKLTSQNHFKHFVTVDTRSLHVSTSFSPVGFFCVSFYSSCILPFVIVSYISMFWLFYVMCICWFTSYYQF